MIREMLPPDTGSVFRAMLDDLSTVPEARRRGHGRALLDWLLEEGRRLAVTSCTSTRALASTVATLTGST